MFPRQCGLILHPSALPGPYGIGEIGEAARAFVRELHGMGQRIWQVLPLVPTGLGNSPYGALSAFAGNHLLIDFGDLMAEGLLLEKEIDLPPNLPRNRVDFDRVIPARTAVLNSVCDHFEMRASKSMVTDFHAFCLEEKDWLDDYALFIALKEKYEGRTWMEWPQEIVRRDAAMLSAAASELADSVKRVKVMQFLFFRQWRALLRYCDEFDVKVLGDLPIFVAGDSVDVWAHQALFYLDENHRPSVVGGVPPDYFSEIGQRWGNPLYRWDVLAERGYAWWIQRIRKSLEMVHILRIDHFRGFEAYWEIPSDEPTAINGKWVKGPGMEFFNALHAELGTLPIVAEDLGHITDEVRELLRQTGYPGMKIAQFSFGAETESQGDEAETIKDTRPHSFAEHLLAYTGTHDNNTTLGWFHASYVMDQSREPGVVARERQAVLDYLTSDGSEVNWDLIRVVWQSRAHTAIAPLQDVLGLGADSRFNTPGLSEGNWAWRFQPEFLTKSIRNRLTRLTKETGRLKEFSQN